MRTKFKRIRRRNLGWWLLELGASLVLITTLLLGRVASDLGHARLRVQQRRRRVAYFLARGIAAEVRLSKAAPDPYLGPLSELEGLRRELPRLRLSRAARGDLDRLELALLEDHEGFYLEIHGPGVREFRRLGELW